VSNLDLRNNYKKDKLDKQLISLIHSKTDHRFYSKRVGETLNELGKSSIRDLYEKIYGPLSKKKKVPSDEEMRKSILTYAKRWSGKMKEHAGSVLESCPKPPKEPGSI